MYIKTRAHLYGQEATELLKIISMYPGLSIDQLKKFYPGKEEVVPGLLSHFIRQGRIRYGETCTGYFPAMVPTVRDRALTDAVWVLLDFIGQAEYHSVSDFPVKLIFFAEGELYEVVSVPKGQETLITHILSQQDKSPCRRILVVDEPEQIMSLHIPFVSGYCTVSPDGRVSYFKKQ